MYVCIYIYVHKSHEIPIISTVAEAKPLFVSLPRPHSSRHSAPSGPDLQGAAQGALRFLGNLVGKNGYGSIPIGTF